MTGLAGEIEKKVASFNQGRHGWRVAHIRKIDSHAIANVMNVKDITAVFGNHAVHQRDFGVKTNETPRKGRANEAEPAGDEHVRSGELFAIKRHGGL